MQKLTGLQGKIAVITSDTQGLGAACAHLLAARGATGLLLCGRQTEKDQQVAESINAKYSGCQAHFATADLAQIDAPEAIFNGFQTAF